MPNQLTTIGIIFGGASGEHAVSIKSAKTIVDALKEGKNRTLFKVINTYIDQQGKWWNSEIADKVLEKGCEPKADLIFKNSKDPTGFRSLPRGTENVDIWFPVLHGPNGEDGTIQGLFKLTQKPFVGSGVLGSALGMDKVAMKTAFAEAGLPQVKYCVANTIDLLIKSSLDSLINQVESKLGYPCFIKPANLGSSVGISKAFTKEELLKGLRLAGKLDKKIVIEQNVSARELECGILGKKEMKASVVGEVRHNADWYDYETKYSEGSSKTIIPAPIPKKVSKKIQEIALLAAKSLSVEGIARVDFFYKEDTEQVWINEINTIPGFTQQSMYPLLWRASGLNIEQLVAMLVATAKE